MLLNVVKWCVRINYIIQIIRTQAVIYALSGDKADCAISVCKLYIHLKGGGGKIRTPPTGGGPPVKDMAVKEAPSCLAATSAVKAFFGTGAPLVMCHHAALIISFVWLNARKYYGWTVIGATSGAGGWWLATNRAWTSQYNLLLIL